MIYLLTLDHEESNCKEHQEDFHDFSSEIDSEQRTIENICA
jgi:hypothetical protein